MVYADRNSIMKRALRLGRNLGALVAIPIMLTAVAGCTSAPVQSAAPGIVITHPTDGDTVSAGALQVNVDVSNFILVDKLGKANAPGEGHIHYFLDIAAPTTPGQPAIPASGTWAATPSSSYSFENVSVGTHTIAVELVNNDHTPLDPPVVFEVTFSATPGGIPAK
jgi:hypothetical protein